MNSVKVLLLANGICGAILLCGGSITAYVASFHNAEAVAIIGSVLGGIGLIQSLTVAIVHVVNTQLTASTALKAAALKTTGKIA